MHDASELEGGVDLDSLKVDVLPNIKYLSSSDPEKLYQYKLGKLKLYGCPPTAFSVSTSSSSG
jgi:hypothetical protein